MPEDHDAIVDPLPAAVENPGSLEIESLPETDGLSQDLAAPDELALARDLILKAHPHIVEELVNGGSLAEMLASVPAAEAAFARVIAAVQETTRDPAAAPVPGGGVVRSAAVNVEGLGPLAKIRAGIRPS